ncbi:hypothetical protein F5Y18DRAFT_428372 [Xylariaceae sp. FL1019]|nr:hypothetical protein F5Y18DRAFT_428372 [Xylariaceae sp. FL1019]
MSSTYATQGNAQTPGTALSLAQQDSIPLECAVCPKKNARFSDLSHLLTHISSKGHLHNMFQLSLTRDIDASAADALRKFDAWFAKHKIRELLRARMNAREQRGTQQGRSQPAQRTSETPSRRGGARKRHNGHTGRGRGNNRVHRRQDDFDIIKLEPDDDFEELYAGYQTGGGSTPYYVAGEDDSSMIDPSDQFNSPYPSDDGAENIEDDTGVLVLKGVVYPGMAGFDSATPFDRRMRNQKKDPAVLKRLEAGSRLVSTVEEILDLHLNFQRARDVYDEPSIAGSDDEDDDDIDEELRVKRRRAHTGRSTATSTRRRSYTRSRLQPMPLKRDRTSLPANQSSRRGPVATLPLSSMTTRRTTRSSTNRRSQLPHNHGLHPKPHEARDIDEMDDEGVQHLLQTPTPVPSDSGVSSNFAAICLTAVQLSELTGHRSDEWTGWIYASSESNCRDRLPGLALRPGNPNSGFATPTSHLRKSPPQFPGKENNHLLMKSPSSSSNPYLQASGDLIETSNYNPLYVQPRDGLGYRLYPSYDEEHKAASSSFQPINANTGYDSGQVNGVFTTPYHRNHSAGDDYGI